MSAHAPLAGRSKPAYRALKELGRKLEEKTDGKAYDVGDAALHPLHQGRSKSLDSVPTGATRPLAEVHITLLFGVGEPLEDDLGAFEAAALLPLWADDHQAAHHGVAAPRHAVEVGAGFR